MRKITFVTLSLLLLIGCGGEKMRKGTPVVDVTKSYPTKEIVIQDIADVEYVPLETKDDVLIEGNRRNCMISPDSLLVGNYREGSVFLFNGKGKVLSKFNHKGASDREYKEIWGIYYDNKAKEIIILDYMFKKQFQVYDINGKYKRTIPISKDYNLAGNEIINFNTEALLCHKNIDHFKTQSDTAKNKIHQPFLLLSKKDGKELGRLPIKYAKRVTTSIIQKFEGGGMSVRSTNLNSIIKQGDEIICSDASKDTVFVYTKNQQLKPLVIRTPEVAKMDESKLSFLQIIKVTPRYIFGEIVDKRPKEKDPFPRRTIVIDRKNHEIFNCDIKNNNFKNKLGDYWLKKNNILYGVDFLKELSEKGLLKGKLNSLVEKLKEDDNPVWVKIISNE